MPPDKPSLKYASTPVARPTWIREEGGGGCPLCTFDLTTNILSLPGISNPDASPVNIAAVVADALGGKTYYVPDQLTAEALLNEKSVRWTLQGAPASPSMITVVVQFVKTGTFFVEMLNVA